MGILLLLGSVLLQLIVYWAADHYKIRFVKAIFFILLMIFYLKVFPGLLMPEPATSQTGECAMLQFIILLFSRIICGGLTFFTHIAYWLTKYYREKSRYSSVNSQI